MPENKIIKIGEVISRASVDSSSYNAADGTIDVIFATEEPVITYHWDLGDHYQVLECTNAAIRSARLDSGAVPFLDSHNKYTTDNVLGRVISWKIENSVCRATIKLATRDEVKGKVQDIKEGILRNVSVYAKPFGAMAMPKLEGQTLPTYRITDWEPQEISLVTVNADYRSIVRSADGNVPVDTHEIVISNYQNINRTAMPDTAAPGTEPVQTPAAQQPATTEPIQRSAEPVQTPAQPHVQEPIQRAAAPVQTPQQPATPALNIPAEIVRSCSVANLDNDFAIALIERNLSLDASKAAIIDEIARRAQHNQPQMRNNMPNTLGGYDERAIQRSAMISGLMHRAEPGSVDLSKPENEKARDYQYSSMVDIARSLLRNEGHRPEHWSNAEVISRAIATTDFPDILTSTAQRFLRRDYEAVTQEWKMFGQQVNAPDFRAKTGIKIDANVTFEELEEGGEYKESRVMSNEKAIVQLRTFARKFSITRKSMINDDLNVLTKLPRWIALGAQQFQAKKFWALLTANAVSSDGVALFHTSTHKNLASSGGAIGETTLSAARTAMRRQKSPEGNELGIVPKFLLIPAELETVAQKIVTSITADQTGNVNVFAGKLQPIVIDQFTDATAWYLAADPRAIMSDGLVYSYLEGEEGMFTESYIDRDTDNIVQKARIDFDCRVWGHQGWYKNPGA